MASPTALSQARARKSVADAIAGFRAELHELHNRAGQPSPSEMAKKGGRPPAFFGFLRTTTLPTDAELSTFLVAMKQPAAVIEKFRARLKKLERQLKDELAGAAARPGAAVSTTAPVVVNLDNSDARALSDAQAAQTPMEFSAALARLRSTARMAGKDELLSYMDIAKISGKRLSKSAAQRMATAATLPSKAVHVEEYVRACGATEEHVRLWATAYQRLKRGEPPALGHHAGTTTTNDIDADAAPSRTRTAGILAGLTSTDAFTAPKLSLAGRKLILFITAAIADDTGSADTTYRALLRRFGTTLDHWAYGMTLPQLAAHMAQYVGRTARLVPLWPMIHDLLTVAIRDTDTRTRVLADAAGLYSQVDDNPPPGHAATMHLPWWGYPITGHTQLDTIHATLPQPGHQLTPTELELIELREDKTRLRQALDTALRAVRVLTQQETQLADRENRGHQRETQLDEREIELVKRAYELTSRKAHLLRRKYDLDKREAELTKREAQLTAPQHPPTKHPLTKRQRQAKTLQQEQQPTAIAIHPNLKPAPQPPDLPGPATWPLQHASGT